MLENRVVRKVFWTKRDEVKGKWRKLHNDELYHLCCSPNINREVILRMECERHMACMGERGDAYKMVLGRLEGKRSLDRPRRRCEKKY